MPKGTLTAAEIHRRIAAGQPVKHIARETGRQLSVVYHHRRGRCRCPENIGPVDPEPSPEPVIVPADAADIIAPLTAVGVASEAFLAGVSVSAIAAALGVETINPDLPDFGFGEKPIAVFRLEALRQESAALVRMRREHPGQWAVIQTRRAEVERKVRVDGRAIIEKEDFADLIRILMNNLERTFLAPIRDRAWTYMHLQVYIHDLIRIKAPQMMLDNTDVEALKVLIPWAADAPGMIPSWEKTTDGMERCSRGDGAIAVWVLKGRRYCDICVLERLRKGLVIDDIFDGPYVHDPVFRGCVVSNEPGEETIVHIGREYAECHTKEDFFTAGPDLRASVWGDSPECQRCGGALPERLED